MGFLLADSKLTHPLTLEGGIGGTHEEQITYPVTAPWAFMITLLTNLDIQFLTFLDLSPIAMLRFSLLIPPMLLRSESYFNINSYGPSYCTE